MSVLGHYISRPDATGNNRQYSLVKTIKDIENEPVGSFSGNNYSISSYNNGFLGIGKGYVNLKIGQNQMIGTGKVDNKEYNLIAYQVTTTPYYRGTFTYANCNQSIK